MREGGHRNPQTTGGPPFGRGWQRQHLSEVIRKPYLSILVILGIACLADSKSSAPIMATKRCGVGTSGRSAGC